MSEDMNVLFKKSKNHIYETCDSFAVMGMQQKNGGESFLTIELCRDIVGLKEGPVNDDETQQLRLNLATVSISVSDVKDLIRAMQGTIARLESNPPKPEE